MATVKGLTIGDRNNVDNLENLDEKFHATSNTDDEIPIVINTNTNVKISKFKIPSKIQTMMTMTTDMVSS